MTTYAYPTLTRSPATMSVEFISNTEIFQSPITGAIQTVDRSGERLLVRVSYNSLEQDDYKELIGWLAKMNGQQHRVSLPYFAPNNRGAFGGTPLVAGASQTGNTLSIDGASLSITNWIRAGDVFSVASEMKIATADANSDGGGNVTLSFMPRLRSSPPDNDPIELTSPTGLFMLATPRSAWLHRPGIFTDFSLEFVEDITA